MPLSIASSRKSDQYAIKVGRQTSSDSARPSTATIRVQSTMDYMHDVHINIRADKHYVSFTIKAFTICVDSVT